MGIWIVTTISNMKYFARGTFLVVIQSALTAGCIVVPIPHTRIHKPKVVGHVVATIANVPLEEVSVVDIDSNGYSSITDNKGLFVLKEKRHWHLAKFYGAINLSIFPLFDMAKPTRDVMVEIGDNTYGPFALSPDVDNIINIHDTNTSNHLETQATK